MACVLDQKAVRFIIAFECYARKYYLAYCENVEVFLLKNKQKVNTHIVENLPHRKLDGPEHPWKE